MVDVIDKPRRPLLNPNAGLQPTVTAMSVSEARMDQLQVEQAHAHASLIAALMRIQPALTTSEDPAAASVLADLEATMTLLSEGGSQPSVETGLDTYTGSLALAVPMLVADDLAALNSVTTSLTYIVNNMRSDDTLPALPEDTDGESGTGGEPINRDVPYASQVGSNLECTMGNWENEPTSYSYTWTVGGVAGSPTPTSTYPLDASHLGQTASCVVTATNATGSTSAPPSNEVTIA